MCLSSPKTPAPVAPPVAPPPPPVLEQAAPKTAAASDSQKLEKRSSGTKKYRNALGISAGDNQPGNTNLSIAQ